MEEERPNDQQLKDVLVNPHVEGNDPAAKLVIGAEEWCAFPALGVPAILARVDSGARTSSIHAFNIQPFDRKGRNWVSFEVHPLEKTRKVVVRCEAPVLDIRSVKSSSGVAEKRYVIQTGLRLWSQEFMIELTLANRDSMGYRMLLGREAMVGRVLVDPGLSLCLGAVSAQTLDHHYRESRRSTDGLRVAILTDQEHKYSHKRIIEACEERGHFVSMIDVRKSFLSLKNESCDLHERDQGLIQGFDCMLPRFSAKNTAFGLAVLRHFKMLGGALLHTPQSIGLSGQKAALMQMLTEEEVPISASGFAYSVKDLMPLVQRLGGLPCNIQLFDNYEVQPWLTVYSTQELKVLVNALQGNTSHLRVWQSDKLDSTSVIKTLIIGHKVVASVKKDQFLSSTINGKALRYETYQLSKEEKRTVLKVSKLTGLNYLAVDLLRTVNEHVVNDVHASPAFERFESTTGKDIATALVVCLEKICDWQYGRSNEMSEVSRVK